eukprot:symbB.v1.2.032657.t1/scaffold3950.1/size47658/1
MPEDVVPRNNSFTHDVLILGLIERGQGSKAGIYDETLVLDDTRAAFLGPLMVQLAKRRIKEDKLWDFTAASFLKKWRQAVEIMQISDVAHSPYQNRRGGCERCSNRFPHCQLCGPEPTGPAGLVVLRCTYCDPLYVLEPMPFGEDPSGRCVSDGPIEFSSPVYHVYKDQQNVTLVVQRSIYALRAEFARPITVLASPVSIPGELASFEATVANLTFGVDESQMIPVDGSQAWNYSQQLTARFQERIELPIKIFDDVSFHPEYRYFDVELVLPPEQLMGHQGPLHPFVSLRQQETHQAWMMPQNVYRAPILDREDVLSKARVYIWDYPEATAAQTFCTGDCQSWMSRTLVGFVRSVIINARTFDNQPITVSTQIRKDPHFIIKYLPRGEGNEEPQKTLALLTLPEAQRRDDACLTVKDVKKYCIQSVDGVSIYRHRLLLEDEVLDDTKQLPLELWPLDLQLLVCPFHSPDANTIREFRAAVRSGEDAALEALLKKGIDPNLPGERWHGGSALQLASSNGSVEMVRMLLEATSDPNMADHEGKSPLLVASNKGYLEIVRCLLEMDADANLANCNDNTPLWVASWKGHLEVVRSLLKFKANHRKVNHNVESALWVASEHGHLKVVQLLIDAEAHVDSCDYNNTSPLWVASWKGHREVVDLLLQSKANQHLMDKVFGATPLWVARS